MFPIALPLSTASWAATMSASAKVCATLWMSSSRFEHAGDIGGGALAQLRRHHVDEKNRSVMLFWSRNWNGIGGSAALPP